MTPTIRSRRATLIRRAAFTTLTVVILYISYQLIKQAFLDDDDRPPIIVNQGSVVFTAEERDGKRGLWKQDFWGSKWRIDHPRKAPTYLVATDFRGSSNCAQNTTLGGSTLVLNYAEGGTAKSLTIEVSGLNPPWGTKHIKIDFGQATPVKDNDYTLRIPDPVGVNKTLLTSVTVGASTCMFDGDTRQFELRHQRLTGPPS
jgi:hypothetical protein